MNENTPKDHQCNLTATVWGNTVERLTPPFSMSVSTSDWVHCSYSSSGVKLRKEMTTFATPDGLTTDYSGEFVYEDGVLAFVATPFGRAVPSSTLEGQGWRYCYHLKDYLGNVRAEFAAHDCGQPELLQQTDYYPFGYTLRRNDYGVRNKNRHLFGGKELQDETLAGVTLNLYDFEARMYDPTTGRFLGVDPLAEKYYGISPFAYCGNDPVNYIDSDGKKIKLANNYAGAMKNIAQIAATNFGGFIINSLINSKDTYYLKSNLFKCNFNSYTNSINYVAKPWFDELSDGGSFTSMISMGHELFHAFDHSKGNVKQGENELKYLEARAVSFANHLRESYSLYPLRNRYGNIKEGMHQFSSNERITEFNELDSNEDGTAYGYSFKKTTTTILSYNNINGIIIPDQIKTETFNFFMTVSMDKEKNVSFKLFDNKEDYDKATSNW